MIYFPQPIRPPFRAEFVGLATTPEILQNAREKFNAGQLSVDELENLENEALQTWVNNLYEIGYDEVCDGGLRGQITTSDILSVNSSAITFNAEGPLLRNFNSLLTVTPLGVVARQDTPSPSTMYADLMLSGGAALNTVGDLHRQIVNATIKAMMALYEIGCRSVLWIDHSWEQGDATTLSSINNEVLRELPQDFNVALRPVLSDLTVSKNLESVTSRLQLELVKAFYINVSVPGAKELFNHIPADKLVVVSLTPDLGSGFQNATDLEEIVKEISSVVELERLSLGTDASADDLSQQTGSLLGDLRLVKDVADEIW